MFSLSGLCFVSLICFGVSWYFVLGMICGLIHWPFRELMKQKISVFRFTFIVGFPFKPEWMTNPKCVHSIETYSTLFITLYKIVLASQVGRVVLFIILYKVVLTFESVDEILKCDDSNESH